MKRHALPAILGLWVWAAALPAAATSPTSTAPDTVTLGALRWDRTEVSIARFGRFVTDTGTRTRAEAEGGGFEFAGGWTRRPGWTWRTPEGQAASDALPAVHLNFDEAAAFCRWAGGRLPTAAEWDSAAYTEQRASPPPPFQRGTTYPFPTGSSPEGANTSDNAGPDRWPTASPTGATRAGVNGLFDMGANVWEWAADQRPGSDGPERRTMGGSWWYGASQMRAGVDAWKPARFYAVYIGLRCVYPADGPAPTR